MSGVCVCIIFICTFHFLHTLYHFSVHSFLRESVCEPPVVCVSPRPFYIHVLYMFCILPQ